MPPACQSLGTPSCLHRRHTREVKHVIFPKHGDLSTAFVKEDARCGAEWVRSRSPPWGAGVEFGPRLGSGSVCARMLLTEGFDATAKQLLHCAALVQV